MSRQDPAAASMQTPTEPQYCVCGDLNSFHKPTGAGGRGACSNSNDACTRFVAAPLLPADRRVGAIAAVPRGTTPNGDS